MTYAWEEEFAHCKAVFVPGYYPALKRFRLPVAVFLEYDGRLKGAPRAWGESVGYYGLVPGEHMKRFYPREIGIVEAIIRPLEDDCLPFFPIEDSEYLAVKCIDQLEKNYQPFEYFDKAIELVEMQKERFVEFSEKFGADVKTCQEVIAELKSERDRRSEWLQNYYLDSCRKGIEVKRGMLRPYEDRLMSWFCLTTNKRQKALEGRLRQWRKTGQLVQSR